MGMKDVLTLVLWAGREVENELDKYLCFLRLERPPTPIFQRKHPSVG